MRICRAPILAADGSKHLRLPRPSTLFPPILSARASASSLLSTCIWDCIIDLEIYMLYTIGMLPEYKAGVVKQSLGFSK
eukprot:9115950-Pyramimonas_sp.AAC.1